MSLTFDQYALWCPGRGVALAPVSGEVSGLTLVAGRSGAGATLLLDSLASLFPAGAAMRGAVRSTAHRPRAKDVGPRVRSAPSYDSLPDRTVAALLGPVPDRALVEELGLTPHVASDARQLPAELRAALGVVWLVGQDDMDVALLDQALAPLHPLHRGPVVRAVRRLADRGVTVLWAEHHVEEVVPHADHVLELGPHGAEVVAAAGWVPRTLPLPPHAAVARSLGLPREQWFDHEALRGLEAVERAAPASSPRGGGADHGDPVHVDGQKSRLGIDLDLSPDEVVAVLSRRPGDGDAEGAARRLTALRRSTRTVRPTPTLPPGVTVGRLLQHWARRHRTTADTVHRTLDGVVELDPHRRVDQHSAGERSALLTALTLLGPEASLLVDPAEGLDAGARRRLAQVLVTGEHGGAVLCTRDVEFAARAAHRWVLTDANLAAREGPPAALAGELAVPPVLVRAGSRALRARDVVGVQR